MRSRDPSQPKLAHFFMCPYFFHLLLNFKAFRNMISVLGNVKILKRKGLIEGITCNVGLGTSQKAD